MTVSTLSPATSRQTWALFCATKVDFRGLDLSKDEASEAIDALRNGNPLPAKVQAHLTANGKSAPAPRPVGTDFQAIHDEAHNAGMAAANGATLQPFNVQDMFTGEVSTGAPDLCGFGWVTAKALAGKSRAFLKWAEEKELFRKNTGEPGFTLWVGGFGQSVNRKAAYATAYAGVLCKHGIKAYGHSRLD